MVSQNPVINALYIAFCYVRGDKIDKLLVRHYQMKTYFLNVSW